MSKRTQRVNELIKREISKIILRNIECPLNVLITVTRVKTAANLRDASVFISVLPEKEFERIFGILNKEIYEIQGYLNRLLKMRPLPRIQFLPEKETREAGRIEDILVQLKKEKK
ncbi:30S ribosome-binding factor RbfA [Patescibacteria group bacterium]